MLNPKCIVKEYDGELYVIDHAFSRGVVERIRKEVTYLEENATDLNHSVWASRFHDKQEEYIKTHTGFDSSREIQNHLLILNKENTNNIDLLYWFQFLFFPRVVQSEKAEGQHGIKVFIDYFLAFKQNIRSIYSVYEYMHTPPFVKMLSTLTNEGIDLSEINTSFSLTKYGKNAFISSHTDYSIKDQYRLTVLYYLNDFDSTHGGGLNYMLPNGEFIKIPPTENRLVIFKPSQTSNHFVPPVLKETEGSRYCISGWFM